MEAAMIHGPEPWAGPTVGWASRTPSPTPSPRSRHAHEPGAGPSVGWAPRTPSPTPAPWPGTFQDYNEKVQDNLYLQQAQLLAEERFQDYIYLRFAQPQPKAAAAVPKCRSAWSTTTGGSSTPTGLGNLPKVPSQREETGPPHLPHDLASETSSMGNATTAKAGAATTVKAGAPNTVKAGAATTVKAGAATTSAARTPLSSLAPAFPWPAACVLPPGRGRTPLSPFAPAFPWPAAWASPPCRASRSEGELPAKHAVIHEGDHGAREHDEEESHASRSRGEPPAERAVARADDRSAREEDEEDEDWDDVGVYSIEFPELPLHRPWPSARALPPGRARTPLSSLAPAFLGLATRASPPGRASRREGELPVERAATHLDDRGAGGEDDEGIQAPRSDGRGPPVKHTFIHYDGRGARGEEEEGEEEGEDEEDLQSGIATRHRSRSAPHVLMRHEFHLKCQVVEQAHTRGECKPCAYYLYKRDGCRRGSACDYCHLCEDGERKKRKKQKARQCRIMKLQALQTPDGM